MRDGGSGSDGEHVHGDGGEGGEHCMPTSSNDATSPSRFAKRQRREQGAAAVAENEEDDSQQTEDEAEVRLG